MFGILRRWWAPATLESFDGAVTRERLIQSGRIVVIDDEQPLLIDELRKEGFAVDYDQTGNDLDLIERQLYDVAIVDYQGVGVRLGKAQGLALLRHIRRVSPRTRLVAYTSRSLDASESEFFRMSHVVLPKDLGLGDSLALIEFELQKAFAKEHLFEALISKLNVTDASERNRLQKALIRSLGRRDAGGFKTIVAKAVGQAGEKATEIIINNLFQGLT